MLGFIMKLEDGLSNTIVVQLVVTSEFCDHGVVGVEFAFHHPLALEDHHFDPGLHASGPPWPLNIPDVKYPLTHLHGMRVFHHLQKIGVDDLLIELVLGGAWRRHGDLDLSEK